MTNEDLLRNSDKAVTEFTNVVSATHPMIKSPENNTVTFHKGNPKYPPQLVQVKPNKTFETVVTSPSRYNNMSSAMVVPSAPPQRYRPYDLMQQQPQRTVNFLSQMEARSMIPIQVRRENPPTQATLTEWASSLQLGDGKTPPLDLNLRLRLV